MSHIHGLVNPEMPDISNEDSAMSNKFSTRVSKSNEELAQQHQVQRESFQQFASLALQEELEALGAQGEEMRAKFRKGREELFQKSVQKTIDDTPHTQDSR